MEYDLKRFVEYWFFKRFKRLPKDDEHYFNEWYRRFETGLAFRYMDGDSLKVYFDMIKKEHGKWKN